MRDPDVASAHGFPLFAKAIGVGLGVLLGIRFADTRDKSASGEACAAGLGVLVVDLFIS
jgi:hypothetical protein